MKENIFGIFVFSLEINLIFDKTTEPQMCLKCHFKFSILFNNYLLGIC